MKYKYILFDLDGTLSQSAEGIRESLEHAISCFDVNMPDLGDYRLYIGPPLVDTFRGLCGMSESDSLKATEIYREYYDKKGKYLNRAYDGIRELLLDLRAQGARLAVCTSKFEKFAEDIAQIIGLSDCFDALCGSTLDSSRKDKKDLIPYALKRLGADYPSENHSAVMIGDTYFDARGAKLSGVDFIGVSYGYGEVEPMLEFGALAVAGSVSGLRELLLK